MRDLLLVTWCSRAGLGLLVLLGTFGCVGQVGRTGSTGASAGAAGAPPGGAGAAGTGVVATGAAGTGSLPDPGTPCTTGASLGPSRVWRLTDEQYVSAVASLFGVRVPNEVTQPDTKPADYTNLSEVVTIDTRTTAAYEAASRTAARAAVAVNLGVFLPCGAAAPSDACVTSFIKNRVARAFRRPLEAGETADLLALYKTGAAESVAAGIRLVIEATLQSPSFLYRTELGAPAAGGPTAKVALTSHELATALSFALLDSIPDDGLWGKALDGSLAQPQVLAAELERLLALPAVQANLSQKAGYWLGVERMNQTEKETSAGFFPEFTPALKQSLYDSARLFVKDIFTRGGMSDLLSSRRMYVNDTLAKVYGIPGTPGKELVAMDLDVPERSAGILTQPAVLAAFSRPNRGDPIHRGLYIYYAMLCGTALPDPPANAAAVAASFPANATERELSVLRANDKNGCGACHALFDPLGLSTERYDPIGRYSANVDASSTISRLGPDLDGPISGLPDLVTKLKSGRRVSDCATINLATYVMGRSMIADNSCALRAVKDRFAAQGTFMDYYRALLTSPGFLTRDAEK